MPQVSNAFGRAWIELLESASKALGNEKLVIAIDALDEVDMGSAKRATNVLFLPRILPKHIFIMVTRRRKNIPLVSDSPSCILDFINYRTESSVDIGTFVQRELAKYEHGRLELGVDSLRVLVEKADCNFMYLRYVIPKIAKGTYSLTDDSNPLPVGLSGYYEDHWRRMGMMDDPLPKSKILVVYVIAESGRPVSRDAISSFSKQDPILVQSVIDEWDEFLHHEAIHESVRYSVYHSSFLDFLRTKRIVNAAGETLESIHAQIADSLWERLE